MVEILFHTISMCFPWNVDVKYKYKRLKCIIARLFATERGVWYHSQMLKSKLIIFQHSFSIFLLAILLAGLNLQISMHIRKTRTTDLTLLHQHPERHPHRWAPCLLIHWELDGFWVYPISLSFLLLINILPAICLKILNQGVSYWPLTHLS